MELKLIQRLAMGGSVGKREEGWRFSLPAGSKSIYRLAQLDDYGTFRRNHFSHNPPFYMELHARVSSNWMPGTWGFGLWNDPFGVSLGFGGKHGRLPTLPQVAWFMYASPPNWLSFRNDPTEVPPNGFFAGTIRSKKIPSLLTAAGLPLLPFTVIRPASRLLRRFARRIIHQDLARIENDVTEWHTYSLQWKSDSCQFSVDDNEILETSLLPQGPLGLVLWIDNQFAAWTPEGRIQFGILKNPEGWLEIDKLKVKN
jgi:hypothetical protein